MSKVCEITVNVDEALSVNKYEVDEETPHIELAEDDGSEAYNEEFLKLVRVCPAALYKIDGDGAKSFDYAGCLECGTCRIACEGTIVKKWVNPGPTMGIEYRLRLASAPRRFGLGNSLSYSAPWSGNDLRQKRRLGSVACPRCGFGSDPAP